MQRLRLCGIENLGNTCYLNTLLQSLKCIDNFENAIIQSTSTLIKKENEKILPVICDLADIFEKMSANPGARMKPMRFINNLQQHIRKHKILIVQQNDIHELYMFFLNMLIEEIGINYKTDSKLQTKLLNMIKINDDTFNLVNKFNSQFREKCNEIWFNHFSKTYSPLIPMFHGQYIEKTKCAKCNYTSNNYTPFNSLLLDLIGDKENVDIIDCIKNHFAEKQLNTGGDKNIYWKCEKCNDTIQNSTQQKEIYKMPQILVVLFKRYHHIQRGILKDDRRILLNDGELDFNSIIGINFKYKLRSIGMHTGHLGGGHYYTIIKDDKLANNYYEVNDTSIHKIDKYNKKHVYMSCWELI